MTLVDRRGLPVDNNPAIGMIRVIAPGAAPLRHAGRSRSPEEAPHDPIDPIADLAPDRVASERRGGARRSERAPNRGTDRILGAAWGAPIAGVEVQIDDGPWQPAALLPDDGAGGEFTWTFWTLDWGTPTAGEHIVTSRAIATDGEVQPAPGDPQLAGKQTYWESNGQITRRVRIA